MCWVDVCASAAGARAEGAAERGRPFAITIPASSCEMLGSMETFRIGSGAGYAGDRIDPARELAERGRLQALVFECLAERTIALAQARKATNPNLGFDPLLGERLRAVLPACRRQGTRIITNMGAANPLAAGQETLRLARELGLKGLRVAVITGDDVLPWAMTCDAPLYDSKKASVSEVRPGLVSANAYLGADALMPALVGEADVIITGRVSDPALFLAPLMHHWGWASDDWVRLGRGTLVGHLLECAAQVCGGYLADPGFVDVPGLADVGFPMAEVASSGDAVITKLADAGGFVNRLSVTAQLLYEIEDPSRYLQPDVTADFSQVRIDDQGLDRVAVSGGGGATRPAALKVSLGIREGFVGEGQISYGGPGAQQRANLAAEILRHRLARMGLGDAQTRIDSIGVNALYGQASPEVIEASRAPNEVRLRLAVRTHDRDQAERAAREVEALYLNGPAAGGGVTLLVKETLAVESSFIPRDLVSTHCHWLEA
jgi:Acyclic terpene utilisation family protein AtuA